MQGTGLRTGQVSQVRGYADQKPRKEDAADPSNRRISVLVQYEPQEGKAPPEDARKGTASAHPPVASGGHGKE